ncbi:hypothetical protein BDB01DRAFT_801248, partial [Pilobolus umbonatus]
MHIRQPSINFLLAMLSTWTLYQCSYNNGTKDIARANGSILIYLNIIRCKDILSDKSTIMCYTLLCTKPILGGLLFSGISVVIAVHPMCVCPITSGITLMDSLN